MRFIGSELVLVPIEIKFYGSGSAVGHSLPKPGSLKEALGQLRETTESLRRVVERASDSEGADRTLWYSAFATLVESGLNLGRGQESRQRPTAATGIRRLGRHAGPPRPATGHVLRPRPRRGARTAHLHGRAGRGAGLRGLDRPSTCGIRLPGSRRGCVSRRSRRMFGGLSPGQRLRPHQPPPTRSPCGASAAGGAGSRQGSASGRFFGGSEICLKSPPTNTPTLRPPRTRSRRTSRRPAGEGVRFPVGRYVGSIGKSQPEFWPSKRRSTN